MSTFTDKATPVVSQRDQLFARATELVPRLLARQADVDAHRRIPEESVAELAAAGMFQLSAPRDYGGYALSMSDYVEVMAELARGCPATAWVTAICNSSAWQAGIFPLAGQDEVFAAGPGTRLASVPQAKLGKARRAEGGIHIEHARWFFNSGVTLADWVVNGITVVDEQDNPLDLVLCLIPTSQLRINNDWHTTGLRGTQSVSTEATNVFVPAHRTVSSLEVLGGRYSTPYGMDQPLFHGASVPTLALFVAPCGIGIAEAALERFKAKSEKRAVAYTTIDNQADDAVAQAGVGEARMKIDAARALLRTAAADVDRRAADGMEMPVAERIRARTQCSYALRLSWEAVDLLYDLSGGSAIAELEPMQRYWRDLKTATLHGLLTSSTTLPLQGRVELGREPNALFV
ncbi:acyl-CoA dehydrogenase family protein [Nocardia mexicana]|uniref:Alkylation response protein AidB-like acyl-CoA dehydrogenase n=1 Tax=Nocardia mexicana TaxID=279262 RepID=A0A370H5V7_9NOCA|nr:acyl-CoA dehydrogenase family protein [Nocardia mexicana]RDI49426.1 alkylation response protein AidB-like acyl-CoA dehydrogenase [Nocardia mexicana]